MSLRRITLAVLATFVLTFLVWHTYTWTETGQAIRFAMPEFTGDTIAITATGNYTRYTEGTQAHQLRSLPANAVVRNYIVAKGVDERGIFASKVELVPAGTQIWEPAGGTGDFVLIGEEGTTLTVVTTSPVNGVILAILSLPVLIFILFWKKKPGTT